MIIQLREARLKANEATEAKLLHIKENPIPNKECQRLSHLEDRYKYEVQDLEEALCDFIMKEIVE